jgi:hypothetical protein
MKSGVLVAIAGVIAGIATSVTKWVFADDVAPLAIVEMKNRIEVAATAVVPLVVAILIRASLMNDPLAPGVKAM